MEPPTTETLHPAQAGALETGSFNEQTRASGSFRDPAGEVFKQGDLFYRRVRAAGRDAYDQLMTSGLYTSLVRDQLLIAHEEMPNVAADGVYKVLRPTQLSFISYPYEWCFSQLRDAALVTLKIQKRALEQGLSLKDASAYNVQFHHGRPVFIDTLSFERYIDGKPWIGYGQFTRHFLAPLALQCYRDARLAPLLRPFLDGIPVDLALKLLPASLCVRKPFLWLNLRLQAAAGQDRSAEGRRQHTLTKASLIQLVDHLQALVSSMELPETPSPWVDYYVQGESYTEAGLASKTEIVLRWLTDAQPSLVWDLGANKGRFSRLAAELGATTIAVDGDFLTVESAYRAVVAEKIDRIIPLHMDLTNASPALGWDLEERLSLTQRGPADVALALALIHHLVITKNVPLDLVAKWLARCGRTVIVEFIPPDDPQVKRLLAGRTDGHPYSQNIFERALAPYFTLQERTPIADSKRILYRLRSTSL